MTSPTSRKLRRALRLAGWRALLLILGLASIAVVAETALRLSKPFMTEQAPTAFVPGVGLLLKPNAEIRMTNGLDFWTVSRTNSLGFLDREPPSPEQAAASCHITIIGDSFVEASQVQIADKVQVRLEELAARELPQLNVTTSAFGRSATAQASQLPFYDNYARRLAPKMLVLLFISNDLKGNSALATALRQGWNPDKPPFAFPQRTGDGRIRLRPPSPQYRSLPPSAAARYRLKVSSTDFDLKPKALLWQTSSWLIDTSYFAKWLHVKTGLPIHRRWQRQTAIYWREHLRQRPAYQPFSPRTKPPLPAGHPSLLAKEALEFTAFALRQFAERAQRDGASLLVLSEFHLNDGRLKAIARTVGIAVLSLHDYAAQHGLRLADLRWEHDGHWNPIGHQHAAAALLEYLKENQDVCGGSLPTQESRSRANTRSVNSRPAPEWSGEAAGKWRRIEKSAHSSFGDSSGCAAEEPFCW